MVANREPRWRPSRRHSHQAASSSRRAPPDEQLKSQHLAALLTEHSSVPLITLHSEPTSPQSIDFSHPCIFAHLPAAHSLAFGFFSLRGDPPMATPSQDKHGEREPTALQRTPEIRETESGNVEVRKDPEHTSKLSKPAEKILDPRGASVATSPHDILAVRRTVDEPDTPLD